MNAHRLPDDEHREPAHTEHGRDDLLRLVRQRLAKGARVVRLSGRARRAVGASEPVVPPPTTIRD